MSWVLKMYFIYLVSSLSSPISTFMSLFRFLPLFGLPFPRLIFPLVCCLLLFLLLSSVCLSRSKTCITSMMAVPHQQEQSKPHSYPSTERRRFSCNSPPPLSGVTRIFKQLATPCKCLLSANATYFTVATSTDNEGLVTLLQAYNPNAELDALPAALSLHSCQPASHPPHSSHHLVTTDLHARRCTNHISCTYTRTSNLFIISSLRYNQLRPTNSAADLSIERTLNSYSTINAAFQYKN